MSLIDRAKNILLTPKTEWPVIAAEPATAQGLFTGYAAILALLLGWRVAHALRRRRARS